LAIFSPDVVLSKDGLFSALGAGILLPTKSPTKPYSVYKYKSQPGDVLFFSESWAHTVVTHPGLNLMMNFRRFEPSNMLRNLLVWMHGIMNIIIFKSRDKGKDKRERNYNNWIFDYITNKLGKTCSASGISKWDQAMTEVIRK
jgi:hypothetical protein